MSFKQKTILTKPLKGTIVYALSLFVLTVLNSCSKGRGKDKLKEKQTVTEKQVDNRPNIIMIMCDDLGYADVGFNGSIDIETPALDKLAGDGIILTSAYVAHPFCGPSRAGIMTGRYPHTIGAQYNLPPNNEGLSGIKVIDSVEQGITLKETFISKVLQDAGYYTGAIGKWHLGATPAYHPNKRGFDEFYGFLGGGHSYFPDFFRPIYEGKKEVSSFYDYDYLMPLEYNGKEVNETEYLTDGLSREAVNFIKKASKKEEPFFLYLAYNAPHTPLEAKEEDLKKYAKIEDKKRRIYAAMVSAVDRGVDHITKALNKTGQMHNTLIVFLSDNGGRTDKGGRNLPLRGRKGNTLEGGIRVPMFFHWPNSIPAGKVYDYPISALDFYPTFAKIAGVDMPKEKKLDGKNVIDALLNETNPREGEPILALRHRLGSNEVGVRINEWKANKEENKKWALYNITNDIAEKFDLSHQYPQKLDSLILQAKAWSDSHISPKWFHDESAADNWKITNMPNYKETFSN